MKIERVLIDVYRAPVTKPVRTSFSVIPSRALAVLRLQDSDGAVGWGEIWGNFPTFTTEYRAKLAAEMLPNLLIGQTIDDVPAFRTRLVKSTHVIRVQSGEPGPVASVVAAADQALWDLKARKAGLPLRRLLNPDAADAVPAYASGLNPGDGPETVEAERARGHRAFKQKIGFGDEVDQGNVRRIVDGMAAGERLFVDANQRWTLEESKRAADWLAEAGVGWLEEPMPADAPDEAWLAMKAAARLPLAGAENLRGEAEMASSFRWFDFIQPDVGKWGGVSGCFAVAKAAIAAGRTYCPHWLSGPVGLLHSAQLLAAAGGDGLLEMDVNENPLRTLPLEGVLDVIDGQATLPASPGVGDPLDLARIAEWRIDEASCE